MLKYVILIPLPACGIGPSCRLYCIQGSKNLFCASRRIVSGAIFLVAFSFTLVAVVRQDSKV